MDQGRKPEAQTKSMAETYVEAVGRGEAPREAAREAGYSDKTKIIDIERPGGPVDQRVMQIRAALKDKGIDDDWLAGQYANGVAKAISGEEFEGMAHAKYLLQIGYLLGHGAKFGTTVAVQVNNGVPASSQGDDPERARELIGEVSELIAVLKAEIGERKPGGVHGAGPGPADQSLPPHQGVDTPLPDRGEHT